MARIDYSEKQRFVLKQAEKLLRLASSTTHQAERESAEKKVQDLLLAYNLSASAIGDADEGRRSQEKLKGGFYKYERDLWSAVAEINFCLHWCDQDYVERSPEDAARKKVRERYSGFAQMYRKVTRQHLVGRTINVDATQFMVKYLKEAIERELRKYLFGEKYDGVSVEVSVVGAGEMLRSKRATSFRDGCAARLASRLWRRRYEQEQEEAAKQRAEKALRANGSGGDGTGTALTISSVRQSERDANMDVIMGEGWSAKNRTERAAQAAARLAAEQEYTKWAAANPEEAKAEEEKRRTEERKRSKRGRAPKQKEVSDWSAYAAGDNAGARIGLDPQTTSSQQRKIGAK